MSWVRASIGLTIATGVVVAILSGGMNYFALVVPVCIAAIPIAFRSVRARAAASFVAVFLLLVCVGVTAVSFGPYYLPAVVLMFVGAVKLTSKISENG